MTGMTSGTTVGYSNEYNDASSSTCTTFVSPGADRVYVIDVPANNRLTVAVTPQAGVDLGVYFIAAPATNCVATPTCLGGNDQGGSGATDTAIYNNTGATTQQVFVIVDSFNPIASGGAGTFTLNTTVAVIPAGPPNDTCTAPEVLNFTAGVANFSAAQGSATDDYNGSCRTTGGGKELVYQFTTTAAQSVIVSATGATGVDAVIYLRNTPCATGTELPGTCRDASGGAGNEAFTVNNLAAGTYYLFIDAFTAASSGSITGTVTLGPPIVGPANDTCASPTVLTFVGGTATATGDTTAATTGNVSGDASPTCSSSAITGPDVVYSYTLTSVQNVTITVTPTSPPMPTTFAPVVYVRNNCADTTSANQVSCVSDFTSTPQVTTILNQQPGTYFVWVDSGVSTVGPFSITVTAVTPPPPPMNDSCAAPEVLTFTAGVANFSAAQTAAIDDYTGSCGTAGGKDVVYAFTTAAAQSLTVAAVGAAGVDPIIYLRNSPCATGTEFPTSCRDATGTGGTETMSIPNLPAGTYFLIVDADLATTSGAVTGTVTLGAPILAPPNDQCAGAVGLTLNIPVSASTVSATNDYAIPAACFVGVGNTTNAAPGIDVTYSFTPATAGLYSFRGRGLSSNLTMYLSQSCETGTPPLTLASCFNAVNRNSNTGANALEEIPCVALDAGVPVFAYVDAVATGTGSSFDIEVNACRPEVEPNGTPATASALACPVTGSATPNADLDFYSLGTTTANSRVFALAETLGGSSVDFVMRVTTATDTLEFDDDNGDSTIGTTAPVIAGTVLPNAPTFLEVNYFNTTTSTEPYRVHYVVQPPSSSAIAETEPNDTTAAANSASVNYFSGSVSAATDIDVFSFTANAGDSLMIAVDGDPLRDNTPVNLTLTLLDAAGATVLTAADSGSTSSTTSGAGTLTSTTPTAPAEGLVYRVRTTGTYYARVTGAAAGDYLLSVSKNCVAGP